MTNGCKRILRSIDTIKIIDVNRYAPADNADARLESSHYCLESNPHRGCSLCKYSERYAPPFRPPASCYVWCNLHQSPVHQRATCNFFFPRSYKEVARSINWKLHLDELLAIMSDSGLTAFPVSGTTNTCSDCRFMRVNVQGRRMPVTKCFCRRHRLKIHVNPRSTCCLFEPRNTLA